MLAYRTCRSLLAKSLGFPTIPDQQNILRHVFVSRFHGASVAAAKIYLDRENMYAHGVLEHSIKPYQIFRVDDRGAVVNANKLLEMVLEGKGEFGDLPQSADSADEVYNNLCALTSYCRQTDTRLSDPRFKEFVERYCGLLDRLSDEQLVDSLRLLTQLPAEESIKSPNFVELWNALDVECCRRIERWSSNQLLLVCDAWYKLNLARICEYFWEALRKLGRKVRKMSPEQLVQTMFFCNVMRRSVFEMFDFEVNLAACAKEMTLPELGVMAMGFFKTQTPIRNPELLAYLYRRLIDELDSAEDITLVSFLKVLRYSSRLAQVGLMMELLDKLYLKKVESISLLSCLHVALLGCELQCCHDPIVEKILHRFNNELANTRLKDLERICLVIALFNIHTSSGIEEALCSKILDSLQTRIDEIMKHPRCFTNCLHFLTLRGYYDQEMLASVLEPEFLRHALGSNIAAGREFFHLDSFVKINLHNSDYTGPQLPEKYRRVMGKMLTQYIPERNPKFKLNATDNILMQIKETMGDIFRHTTFKHILPHYERSDIVICYDRKQRTALPLSPDCPADYTGAILTREELLGKADGDDVDTVAVVIAGWNNMVREKNRYTGLFDFKLKQLQLLGHKYIVIYWHEWRELETHADRVNFLKRRLSTVINL